MNMLEMLMQAQGGNAMGNLGQQFGLSEQQTQDAVRQMLPALSSGFKQNTASEDGLAGLIGALQNGQHESYYDDPNACAQPQAALEGNGILGHVLGSKDVSRAVADRASANTGIGSTILKQMLPVIASMVMGAISKQTREPSMQQALGGLLGGGSSSNRGYQSGGLESVIGGVLGSVLGGSSGGRQSTGSAGDILGSILDADGDGSVADDLLQIAGRMMR